MLSFIQYGNIYVMVTSRQYKRENTVHMKLLRYDEYTNMYVFEMLGINNYIHKAPQLVISALELFEKAENGDIWQELENENKDWVWFVCRPESDYLEATKNDIQQANETSVTNNADVEADVEAEEEEDARGLDPRRTERNNRYDFYSQMYSQYSYSQLHPITLSNKISTPNFTGMY